MSPSEPSLPAPLPTQRAVPRDAATLPRPFDAEAGQRLVDAFGACQPEAAPRGADLLAAIGGHSPYLTDLALREHAILATMLVRGPDAAFATLLSPLARAAPDSATAAIGGLLRQAKRQGALVIAAADIAGLWPLDRITGALSDLAEATLGCATRHLLHAAHARGELKRPKRDGRGDGLIVLGMGKLGARELNYSSDIDLILLFDGTAANDPDQAQAIFVRIARDLVRLMEERTEGGYVFRTDLRLRPDPGATPLAVGLSAAISYYESMGQNWERAAMIKARPVAGDRAAGDGFLREIRPFVWRRYLDFAMIADIGTIKRQIHTSKSARGAGREVAVAGHDIKLGRGGIREIEFTAQALQLIWGGRDPGLRDPTTLGALSVLAAAGRIGRRAAADLADAYVFLRTLEHRLQMIADRQTHRLPEDPVALANVASFMGFSDTGPADAEHAGTAAFAATLTGHLRRVEKHYAGLFEHLPALTADPTAGDRPQVTQTIAQTLVFTGPDEHAATLEALAEMGFADPRSVAGLVRSWLHGRPRATRSDRARELLAGLLPALLTAFANQSGPDAALARFDAVLNRLPAGVQALSLLAQNLPLLDRLAFLLAAAPALADHLASHPAVLEGLLYGSSTEAEAGATGQPNGPSAIACLPALVRDARHLEEALDLTRRLAVQRRAEIDAAALEGVLSADAAGLARSELADTAVTALLPAIAADFATRYGKVKGGAMTVVALGKLGGREMLPASDLDLVLIYDHDAAAEASTGGPRSLPAATYFSRLAQSLVSALTAPGAEGRLYEVDMRLRPSGSKGPVAVRLAAFQAYHADNAWTWERMAMTRARVVAGPAAHRRRVTEALRASLLRPVPAAVVLGDAASMRARLLRELPPGSLWDVKGTPGGLIEVEFIAQALQLVHAKAMPQVLRTTTREALAALGKAGVLPEAPALIAAEALWRTILSVLRLSVGRGGRDSDLPGPTAAALIHAAAPFCTSPPVDQAGLRQQMALAADTVRAAFLRHIGPLPETPGKLLGGTAK
ncbi:bifunctional [glutamine synthetase] adenylyltransferase/[glutamine synthetase]-adenylyl-L-tyrosine phosphorylase [Humitalea sp. 24SJ18S-53]|uniref:bifunctional [glutamine synthetase] adenylyltransferase/[glutamine synthetase]-adenylyl-L-tyrosine phosphorylase n=1 Tax=Humitalea sp. 24SJ18S-53 TaxID=3422307 RepID=UPI003D667C84